MKECAIFYDQNKFLSEKARNLAWSLILAGDSLSLRPIDKKNVLNNISRVLFSSPIALVIIDHLLTHEKQRKNLVEFAHSIQMNEEAIKFFP